MANYKNGNDPPACIRRIIAIINYNKASSFSGNMQHYPLGVQAFVVLCVSESRVYISI